MSTYTIVNNQFLPAATASVLITDLAVQRGYGIFDFFKTIGGGFVFLDDHLDRFFSSAEAMRLPVGKTRDELKALLSELMSKNNIPDSGFKITLTGGYSADSYTLSATPNMIITQQPLVISREISAEGIKLITHPHQRQLPHVKTLDYLMAIWLQPIIKQQGADDVLYYSNDIVRECPRANFFVVTPDNEVITTGNEVLKGIVRKNVLNLQHSGFTITERDITLTDLAICKEAFITSSTKNILPVTGVDGRIIGNGHAGEVSMALAEKLRAVVFD